MKIDNTSFVDMMTQRLKTYTECCSAAALFYVGHSTTVHQNLWGLRLECPAIAKEFTDNIAFGRDPEGFLFYYSLDDFDTVNKKVNYHCFYNNESPRAVRIDFHSLKMDGTENKNPFCSFVTKNTSGLANDYLTSAETNDGSGLWQDVQVASTYGKIRKETSGDEVTIVMEPIGKEVYFDTAGYSIARSLNIMGTFTYPNTAAVKAGTCKVDFNPDRIVLYDSQDNKKMIGFFIPVKAMDALKEYNWNSATIKDV